MGTKSPRKPTGNRGCMGRARRGGGAGRGGREDERELRERPHAQGCNRHMSTKYTKQATDGRVSCAVVSWANMATSTN